MDATIITATVPAPVTNQNDWKDKPTDQMSASELYAIAITNYGDRRIPCITELMWRAEKGSWYKAELDRLRAKAAE